MFTISQRVKLAFGHKFAPVGNIIEIRQPITVTGFVFIPTNYKVRWEDGDESGWLRENDLRPFVEVRDED